MILDVRLRAFLVAAYFAAAGVALFGQTRITLTGRLFISGAGECRFFVDPEGDSETIDLIALPQGYLCDYLTGSNARRVIITIAPQPK